MFPRIKQDVLIIKQNKDTILDIWLNYKIVTQILSSHDFELDFFRNKFATKVFDSAISIVETKKEFGDCPIIGVMLLLFKKKNIPLADVFMICVHFKNALFHFTHQNNLLDEKMLTEISMLMDYNFNGVIKEYTYIYYNDVYKKNKKLDACTEIVEEETKEEEKIIKNTIPPATQTLQVPIISAKNYLQEIDLDLELISELSELETDTLDAIYEAETITQYSLYEASNLFEQYKKALKMMLEFEDLEVTLGALKNLLLSTDYISLSEDDKNMITIYLKAIINDLQSWRIAVFIAQEADDIHYLDKTLMSSIAQLQITLAPPSEIQEDEIEFF